jgi:hypothetical protein
MHDIIINTKEFQRNWSDIFQQIAGGTEGN